MKANPRPWCSGKPGLGHKRNEDYEDYKEDYKEDYEDYKEDYKDYEEDYEPWAQGEPEPGNGAILG